MSDGERLVGAWRLTGLETGGRSSSSGGRKPDGLITYSADGWMSAQIISPGEGDDGGVDHHAYFGPYSLDEAASIVTHHRLCNTHAGPVDVVRRYAMTSDNDLVITPLNHQGVKLTFRRAGS